MDVLRSLSPSRASIDAAGGSVSDRTSVTLPPSFRTNSDGALSTDYVGPLGRSSSIASVKTHLEGLKHGEESPFHNPFNVLGREESNGIPSSSSSCSNGQLFPFDHTSTRSMFLSDPNTSPSAGEGLSDDREEGLISPPLSVPLNDESTLPPTLNTGISPLFASAINISAQIQGQGNLSVSDSGTLQSRDQSVGSIRDQSRLPTPIPLPSSHAHSTSFISNATFALHNRSPTNRQKNAHLTSTTLLADGLSALQHQQQTALKDARISPKSTSSSSAVAIARQDIPSARHLTISTDVPTILHPHISPKTISPMASIPRPSIPLMPTAVVAPALPAGVGGPAFGFNFAPNNSATRIIRPASSVPIRTPLHFAAMPMAFDDDSAFIPGRKRKNWRRAQLDSAEGARRSLQPHYRYRVKLNHGLEQLRLMTCPTFQDATHYDILTCAIARIHDLEEEIRVLEYHQDLARRRREKRVSLTTPKRRKTQFAFEGASARDEEGFVVEGPVSAEQAEGSAEQLEKLEGSEGQAASSGAVKKECESVLPVTASTAGESAPSDEQSAPSQSVTDTQGTTMASVLPNDSSIIDGSESSSVTGEDPSTPPPLASSSSTIVDKEGTSQNENVPLSPDPQTQDAPAASVPSSSGDQPARSDSSISLKVKSTDPQPELLASTPELHSLLFHSACLPRFILSTSFEFIAVNRAYAALFLAPIELRGMSFLSIVQSELVQPASLTLSSVLESPDDVMQIEGLKIVDEGAVYSCELIIWCARETKEDGSRVATCIQGVELSRQPLIMARP